MQLEIDIQDNLEKEFNTMKLNFKREERILHKVADFVVESKKSNSRCAIEVKRFNVSKAKLQLITYKNAKYKPVLYLVGVKTLSKNSLKWMNDNNIKYFLNKIDMKKWLNNF